MDIISRIVYLYRVRFDIIISVVIPLIFFWMAIRSSPGPTYTSDEFAYLAKSAAIAGNTVNYPSSWHSGYPILISPIFRLGLNPQNIWTTVLFTNCVFWIGSFLISSRLIRIWFPKLNEPARGFVILITALYPGWGAISAYAFPNSAFVFFYLLIFLVQSHNKISAFAQSLLSYALLGFLYWIHPIGLVVLVAFLISQLWTIRIGKILIARLALSLISILLILIYSKFIHPLINRSMPLTNFSEMDPDHYVSHLANQLSYIGTTAYWKSFIMEVLSIWGAISVATLGLIFLPVVKMFQLRWRSRTTSNSQHAEALLISFGIFSIILVSLLTAFLLTSPLRSAMQLDHWIFLRYVECVLLPLLPVGLAVLYFDPARSIKRFFWGLPITLYLIGWMLDSNLSARGPTSQVDNHFIMTIGFWPISLLNRFNIGDWSNNPPATSVDYSTYSFRAWMVVGVVGIAICFLRSRLLLIAFCLIQFISVNHLQTEWHEYLHDQYAKPPQAVSQIRSLPTPKSCTGYMTDSPGDVYLGEDYKLLAHYLYDYKLRVLSKDDWVEFCDGPLIVKKSDFGKAPSISNSFRTYDADTYFLFFKN